LIALFTHDGITAVCLEVGRLFLSYRFD